MAKGMSPPYKASVVSLQTSLYYFQLHHSTIKTDQICYYSSSIKSTWPNWLLEYLVKLYTEGVFVLYQLLIYKLVQHCHI